MTKNTEQRLFSRHKLVLSLQLSEKMRFFNKIMMT